MVAKSPKFDEWKERFDGLDKTKEGLISGKVAREDLVTISKLPNKMLDRYLHEAKISCSQEA